MPKKSWKAREATSWFHHEAAKSLEYTNPSKSVQFLMMFYWLVVSHRLNILVSWDDYSQYMDDIYTPNPSNVPCPHEQNITKNSPT